VSSPTHTEVPRDVVGRVQQALPVLDRPAPDPRGPVGMMTSYPAGRGLVAVRKIAVTLPEELFDMVERLREIEHRSRSEVFQEALRRYFGEPVYEPTDEERRLLDGALDAIEHQRDAGRPWRSVRDELWPE